MLYMQQSRLLSIFKFFSSISPGYMSEIFHPMYCWQNMCFSVHNIDLPFGNSCFGQNTLSFILDQDYGILYHLVSYYAGV